MVFSALSSLDFLKFGIPVSTKSYSEYLDQEEENGREEIENNCGVVGDLPSKEALISLDFFTRHRQSHLCRLFCLNSIIFNRLANSYFIASPSRNAGSGVDSFETILCMSESKLTGAKDRL